MFELMFVLVVLGVMALLLAPGMREYLIAQRVRALANDLASDLMLARSEALKRNATAQLVPQGIGPEAGWIVSAGNLVLSWRGAVANGVVVDGAAPTIMFNASGRMRLPATQLRMTVRPRDGPTAGTSRCVELDLSGRVRTYGGVCA